MKNKVLPASIIAFALISTLNTCHNYQLRKESKIGKKLEEKIEEFENTDIISPPTNEINIENEEKVTYYKGKN